MSLLIHACSLKKSCIELLIKIPEYQKNYTDSEVLAAHARTDVEQTPEGIQHDLDIMNDDSKWEE